MRFSPFSSHCRTIRLFLLTQQSLVFLFEFKPMSVSCFFEEIQPWDGSADRMIALCSHRFRISSRNKHITNHEAFSENLQGKVGEFFSGMILDLCAISYTGSVWPVRVVITAWDVHFGFYLSPFWSVCLLWCMLVRFVCDVLRERSRIQMGVFGYQREDHCSWQCIEP